MKLRPRTFQIFWDVHAWAGVVGALLLYVMFFMGAFALVYQEINVWADPTPATVTAAREQRLGPLLEQLRREENILGKERVTFMPEPTGLRAYWRKGEDQKDFRLVAATGRLEPAKSELGSFLYAMHFLDPIPNAIYVAGVASMALFLALITGLLIHLKDLVRQWFQFRPERVPRTWSSDVHKVLGVFGLPYQLLYAWSGAMLCLAYVSVQPLFTATVFGGDERAAAVARGEAPEAETKPTGRLIGTLPDLDAMVARARTEVPGIEPSWIGIEHVGDEASTVSVYGEVPGIAFGSANVVFRARDAAVLHAQHPASATTYQRFEAWFYGLHYAHFGGYGIKLFYALLAFATCAVIITGNLVWLERRVKKRAHVGNRILETLTVAFGAGAPVATAAMFAGNRLLPVDVGSRETLEQVVFWVAWGLATIAVFALRQVSSRRVAGALLTVTSALFAAAAVIDVANRFGRLVDALYVAIDVGLVVLAFVCAFAGARLRRRPAVVSTHVEPAETTPVSEAQALAQAE
jgi:uncharacterized iron-regulated membrane protein